MPASSAKKWTTFFSSRWFIAGGTVVLLVVMFAFGRAFYQNYIIQQEISRLQKEVERLQGKKLQTFEKLQYVKSPAYVEEKARTELNLRKEGEQMAIIPPTSATTSVSGQKNEPMIELERFSNPLRWWRYFFH